LYLVLSIPSDRRLSSTERDFWARVIGHRMGDGRETLAMNDDEAEAFVIRLLKEQGPQSTMQIEKLARKEHKRCPDQTVIFLMKMKKKGLIRGEASLEKKGWVWSTP
jgi:hypothetical protein